MFLADQPAGRALIAHDGGGRAVQAQLVLQAHDLQAVPLPQTAIGIGNELRHHEQADAAGSRRAIWQSGQHQMADVGREIVVAPGDEDLLPGHRISAVAVAFSLGAQRAHVAARTGFGQVHRAAPFATDQARDIKRLDLLARMMLQRLDLALGHQGVQLQRQTGAAHHVVHAGGQRQRQAHAALLGVGGHADPAALGDRAIARGIAGRGAHHAVFQPGGHLVALAVQGREGVFTELPGLGQDRLDRLGLRLGEKVGSRDLTKADHLVQKKAEIGQGGAVGHGSLLRAAWQVRLHRVMAFSQDYLPRLILQQ